MGTAATPERTRLGVTAGVSAYTLWGLTTLYWPLMDPAGAVEVLAHRIVGSFVVLIGAILLSRRWRTLTALVRNPRALGISVLAGAVISVNWGLFIWSVEHDHVVDASLGYYINPLVSVALGVLVLRESLDNWRRGAVAIAAAGVVWLTIDHGSPPWISLTLACSFGTYGLLKKVGRLPALESQGIETMGMVLPALGFLVWLAATGDSTFVSGGLGDSLLLASTGIATVVPLLLFGLAAARIPLSLVGMLQYLTPTLQLLIGITVLDESVDGTQLIGFAMVWAALVVLSIGALRSNRLRREAAENTVVTAAAH